LPKTLVVFDLAGQACAFAAEEVCEIIAAPELAHPPGLPEAVDGILDLGGAYVPVVRLDRLLGLPQQEPGLYTPLIVLAEPGDATNRIAIPVDTVREILSLPEQSCCFSRSDSSLNGALMGEIRIGEMAVDGRTIHLLSAKRIFSTEERKRLADFRAMAEQRLRMLELQA
jgi:purine-binding chemotaxis protein CheW